MGGLFKSPSSPKKEANCNCIKCGLPKTHGNMWKSGHCAPASSKCGPGRSGKGCYSSAVGACDCRTGYEASAKKKKAVTKKKASTSKAAKVKKADKVLARLTPKGIHDVSAAVDMVREYEEYNVDYWRVGGVADSQPVAISFR